MNESNDMIMNMNMKFQNKLLTFEHQTNNILQLNSLLFRHTQVSIHFTMNKCSVNLNNYNSYDS